MAEERQNRIPGLIEEMGLPQADPAARAEALPGLVQEAVRQNFTPEQWNAAPQEKKQEAINRLQEGIREKYQDVFRVKMEPERTEERTEMVRVGHMGAVPRKRMVTIPAKTRPLYDVETERTIAAVREDDALPDFDELSPPELLGTYGLLYEAAPERRKDLSKAVQERAKRILEARDYPTIKLSDNDAETFLKEFANQGLSLSGPMGAGWYTDRLAGVSVPEENPEKEKGFFGSLRKLNREMAEGIRATGEMSLLNAENRALAALAYGDEQQVTRIIGTMLPYLAVGNAALRKLGPSLAKRGKPVTMTQPAFTKKWIAEVPAMSKTGIGVQAATGAGVAAMQGPEYVPSYVADALGIEPNRLMSAFEGGGIDAVFGTALRLIGQSKAFQTALRKGQVWKLRGELLKRAQKNSRYKDVRSFDELKSRMEQDIRAARAKPVDPASTPETPPEPAPATRDPRAEVEARIARDERRAANAPTGEGSPPPVEQPAARPAAEVPGAMDDIEYSEMDTGGGMPVEAPAPESGAVEWRPTVPPPESLRNVVVPARAATAQALVDEPVVPVAMEEIDTLPDLMQFKRIDREGGVNEADRIDDETPWDDKKAGITLLWEPLDPAAYGLPEGKRFVVANGHHRHDKALRSGVKGLNSQILREADGISAADARSIAAEINIADGKGSIYDQAKFIRNEAATYGADAALERARQIGARGRKAATLGIEAEDNLFDAFLNERISPDQAAAVAATAPRDPGLQALGIELAAAGRTPAELRYDLPLAARERESVAASGQTDLFGMDDSALRAMQETSARVKALEKAVADRINSVRNTARSPELAQQEGVEPGDVDALRQRIAQLEEARERFKNFSRDPEIMELARQKDLDPQDAVDELAPPKPRPDPNQGMLLGEPEVSYGGLATDEAKRLNQLQKRVLGGKSLTQDQTREMETLQRKLGQQDFDFYQPAGQEAAAVQLDEMRRALKEGAERRLRGEELESQGDLFGPEPGGQFSLFEAAHRYAATRSLAEQVADPARQAEIFEQTYQQLREIERLRQSGRSYQGELDLGDEGQGPLFSRGGGGAGRGAADNAGRPAEAGDVYLRSGAALRGDPQALKAALDAGETVTAWVSEAITGNVAGWNPVGKIVKGPADMAALRMELSNPHREIDTITAVDTRTGKIVANEIGGIGALAATIADPAAFNRVVAAAMEQVPARYINVYDFHNHPGGDVTPSNADWRIYKARKQQAETVGLNPDQVDVGVTDTNKMFRLSVAAQESVPPTTWFSWEGVPRDELMKVDVEAQGKLDPPTAALMNTMRQSKEKRLYGIFLNNQAKIVGAKRLPFWDEVSSENQILGEIATFSSQQGAGSVILIDTTPGYKSWTHVNRQIKAATGGRVYLRDVGTRDLVSAYEAGILSEEPKTYRVKLGGRQVNETPQNYPEGEPAPEPVGPYYTDGIPDVQPLAVRFGAPPPKAGMWDNPDPAPDGGWIKVGMGGLEKISAIEMPELVDVVRAIQNGPPILKRLPKSLGYFKGDPLDPHIVLDPRIFQNYRQAERTLAHEIGHWADYMDEGDLKRGNILGRIAKLRNYLARSIDRLPRDPSRALTPKDRKELRKVAEEKVGPRPPKDEEADLAAWKAEVAAQYREEINAALDERDLITAEEIRDELLGITQWWKPYDPAEVPESYRQYRESSIELYADALSVLLTAPRELKARAPKFWDSFFGYLDRSPEAKQEFFTTWDFLNRPYREVIEKRRNKRLTAYARGDELIEDAIRQRELRSRVWTGWMDRVKSQFYDVYHPIVKKAREAKKAGQRINPDLDPERFFDEHPFAEGGIYKFMQDMHGKIVRPLEEREISLHDFGEYLMLNRVANEAWENPDTGAKGGRGYLANPGGETPGTARKALAAMRVRLGMEQMTHLEFQAKRFFDRIFEVMRDARQAQLLGDDLWELVQANRYNYAAFVPLEYVTDQVSGAIRAQFGTLQDIANPFTSTVLKMASIKREIQLNQGKLTTAGFLNQYFPGEIERASLVWDGKGQAPKPLHGDPDRKLLELKLEGKRAGYYVPDEIAEMFEGTTPANSNAVTGALNLLFRQYLYPLFITYNPYFQLLSSPFKDLQRSMVNLKGGNRKMIRKTLENYPRLVGDLFGMKGHPGAPEAKQAVRDFLQGRPNPLISEMLELGAMGSPMDAFSTLPRNEEQAFTAVLRKFNVLPKEPTGRLASSLPGRAARGLGKGIEFAGLTFEMLPKVEGYRLMTRELGWTREDAALFVRNYLGVPNFRAKGKQTDMLQAVYPFWNVFQRGLAADMGMAFKGVKAGAGGKAGSRAGWWMRFAAFVGIPTLIQVAAEMGMIGEEMQEWFDGKSEYTKGNFLVAPLGWAAEEGDFGRVPVGLRIPLDETHRLLRNTLRKSLLATWSATTGQDRNHSPSQILAFGAGQIPGLNPVVDIGGKWLTYLSGGAPRDTFRDQPILSRAEQAAGGWPALNAMLEWTVNETGVTNFIRWNEDPGTTTEAVVSAIPGLNRLVDWSDYGYRERQRESLEAEEGERARVRLAMPQGVQDLAGEFYILRSIPNDQKTGPQLARYQSLLAWHREIYTPIYETLQNPDLDKEQRQRLNEQLGRASRSWED